MRARRSQPDMPTDVFPLLRLPPELRMTVYEYVLYPDEICSIYSVWGKKGSRNPVKAYRKPNMALTSFCRQIREESIPIFFSTNIFKFNTTLAASEFFRVIRHKTQYIRRMGILDEWFVGSGTKMMKQLIQAKNLKCLQILGSPDYDKIVRSMEPWTKKRTFLHLKEILSLPVRPWPSTKHIVLPEHFDSAPVDEERTANILRFFNEAYFNGQEEDGAMT
ncbi:hypothetical protein K461DRAFT_317932 [Myriangium duriaei CBS 260.36]|uniref:F-box domain-containing protein n=1 Tax=Myriangium duriaei CBS 260.36 TaxID=1168546 RepID=A0A9P4JAH7_9PEZI|nr:hypothetical protein K461DRAFT_317932 [Myriangium duriaei CBS 260.36]